MEGVWTGIIMRCCEFFHLEYEFSAIDKRSCIYRRRYLPSWSSDYTACRPDLNDLVGREMCRKGTLADKAERGANDTTPRSHLMNALTPETGMFNGFAVERRLAAQARRHQNSSNGFSWKSSWEASWRESWIKCQLLEIWWRECQMGCEIRPHSSVNLHGSGLALWSGNLFLGGELVSLS